MLDVGCWRRGVHHLTSVIRHLRIRTIFSLGPFILLGFLLLPVVAGERTGLQEKQEQLKELRNWIIRERKKAEEVVEKERSLAKELIRLDARLRRRSRTLRRLEARLQGSGERIRRLSQEIAAAEEKLGRAKALLARRLRALYKQGRLGGIRLLLSSDDLSQMARRLKYLSAVASQDRRIISDYTTTLAELRRKKAELEQYKAQIAKSRALAREKRQEILEERRVRRLLLAKVRKRKADHLATLRELEQASKELQALVTRLKAEEEAARRRALREGARPLDGSTFAALKGKLPWPTEGTLASTFGRKEHPRFKTVTFNKGIGIKAPEGREIVAIYDGVVLYADWFRGYGRLLILDHGGGYYTVYAHASELLVKVGDRVAKDQVIAKVGDSGSLDGPQLYFELRYKGKPQDPLAWLIPR